MVDTKMEFVSNKRFDANEDQRTPSEPGENDSRRQLAFKSGFVSLQERLDDWRKQTEGTSNSNFDRKRSARSNVENVRQVPQFATLHEFFQSKSSLRKQCEQDNHYYQEKRPKMPIMKLSKDDWNVKCWEDRVNSHRLKQVREHERSVPPKVLSDSLSSLTEVFCPNRAKKLDPQIKVFHGRIDDVAMKLDKLREGVPSDEQLYKLATNRVGEKKSSHTWTDLLKDELISGVHNPKLLRSQFTDTNHGDKKTKFVKSPLGRPIRRISEDDEDNEQKPPPSGRQD